MKKKLIPLLALLLAAVLLFPSCATRGRTLIEAGDNEISINVFQLYLSRMRYSLKLAGDSVESAEYWETFIDTDNMTQGQLFTDRVLEGLKQIAAALILYDEKGLKLPKETEDQIDALIDQMIEEVGGGSKSQFNSVLSAYGANVTTLRDSYIIEAKIDQLKNEIYGAEGEKIAATAKEAFYLESYYRGKQFCLFNQYHSHDKDAYGQSIYYEKDDKGNLKTDANGTHTVLYDIDGEGVRAFEESDGNGGTVTVYRKRGGIAYDTKNGTPSNEGKRDEAGDLIYYDKDGNVAYDTDTENKPIEAVAVEGKTVYYHLVPAYDAENGLLKYYYEKDGSAKMVAYSDDEWAKIYLDALEFAKTCAEADNSEATFDQFSAKYNQNNLNETVAPNGMYFLTGSAVTQPIYSDFAAKLSGMKAGETAVLEGSLDGGVKAFYVIMRCELNAGAWNNAQNAKWFESFNDLLREHMLQNMVISEGYLDRVVVDEGVRGTVDISMVATNDFY